MTILDNHLKDFISDSGTIFKDRVCRLLCSCHESETQVRGHLLALHFSTHRSMMTAHCRGHRGSHREMFRGQAEKEHQDVPSPGWDASTQPQASRRRHLEVFSWPGSSGHVLQGSELPATEVTKSSRCPTVWTQSVDIFTPSLCVLSVTTSLSDQFSFHSGPPRSVSSPWRTLPLLFAWPTPTYLSGPSLKVTSKFDTLKRGLHLFHFSSYIKYLYTFPVSMLLVLFIVWHAEFLYKLIFLLWFL